MPRKLAATESRDRWRQQFGARLRTLRQQREMSQLEFATLFGFKTAAWVSDVERGINGLDVYDLYRICAEFETDPRSLVGAGGGSLSDLLRQAADQLDLNLQKRGNRPD